ncbi:MAG: hypothetical protein R8M46_06470 [Ghiorsea sp.]
MHSSTYTTNNELLLRNGLNLQAVFNLQDLPQPLSTKIQTMHPNIADFKQLIVFAHGGKDMWQAMKSSDYAHSENPVDAFSKDAVKTYFEQDLTNHNCHFIYPHESQNISLIELGELAGWHHPSPFRVGINQVFGTWFAYRAVVLADTNLPTTPKMDLPSPCDACEDKPCISICPAEALEHGDLSLPTCLNCRLEEGSKCTSTCLSRLVCPIAKEHRYSQEQIKYHYGISMKTIKQYYGKA